MGTSRPTPSDIPERFTNMPRRLLLLILTTLALLAATAPSASAGTSYMSKTTGQNANSFWTQVDNTALGSQFGNVHVGSLYAYETSKNLGDAFVYIDDFDCEAGQLPSWGHDGVEGGCAYVGSRQGHGFGLTLIVDKRLSSASLQGTLTMVQGGGHDGPGNIVGNPGVNMTWTGYGSTIKGSQTYRYNDGTSSFSERYRSTERQATMGGNLGPMTFAPGLSGGSISNFSSMSRGRS